MAPELKENNKPFFLLKTKNELLLAEERKQLVLSEKAKTDLTQPSFRLDSLVSAKVTKNSPGTVVEVTVVDTPEKFLEFAF